MHLHRRKLRLIIIVACLSVIGAVVVFRIANRTPPPLVTVKLGPTNTALRIHSGYGVLIVLPDGTLWEWGDPGMNSATPKRAVIPTQIGTNTDWKEGISANHHCVALKRDGTLWEWGWRAGAGQHVVSAPEQVGTESNWVAIAGANVHSLALKRDGTLWVWGDGTFDSLGTGVRARIPEPVQVGTNQDWVAVSIDRAIRSDGSLWIWGQSGSTVVPFPIQACREKDWSSFSPSGFPITRSGEVWNTYRIAPATSDADESRTKLFQLFLTNLPEVQSWGFTPLGVFEVHRNGSLWRRRISITPPTSAGTIATLSAGKPQRFGSRSNWMSVQGTSTAIGVTTDGMIWTWGADVSRDPIPEFSAQLKLFENKVRKTVGLPQNSLSYGSSFPTTEKPRPLIQMVAPDSASVPSK
jgi:hypothetical protein